MPDLKMSLHLVSWVTLGKPFYASVSSFVNRDIKNTVKGVSAQPMVGVTVLLASTPSSVREESLPVTCSNRFRADVSRLLKEWLWVPAERLLFHLYSDGR